MAKRLTIPKTPAEAERFLWHSIDHLRAHQDLTGSPEADRNNLELSDVQDVIRKHIKEEIQ